MRGEDVDVDGWMDGWCCALLRLFYYRTDRVGWVSNLSLYNSIGSGRRESQKDPVTCRVKTDFGSVVLYASSIFDWIPFVSRVDFDVGFDRG